MLIGWFQNLRFICLNDQFSYLATSTLPKPQALVLEFSEVAIKATEGVQFIF
jgi:hypothetical protein